MNLTKFRGKSIALLGFGIENIAVAKLFLKNQIDFIILDRAPVEKMIDDGQKLVVSGQLSVVSGEKYLENLEQFDIIIRSPGVPFLTPEIQSAKKSGSEITSSTKLFFDFCPAQIIGVTGTKGKGTTASIIKAIIERNFQEMAQSAKVYLIGNIGIAPFEVIEKIKPDDLIVFELSSFQLQDLDKSPHIAVVVNLADDHLDYHQTIEEYRATKQNILKYQNESDFAVINSDYPESKKLAEFGKAKKYYFSSKEKITSGAYANKDGDVLLAFDGEEHKICSQNELKLIGRHNLENIASAAIVGKLLDVSDEIISQSVKEFDGLPHRLEFIREFDGIKFYNDSFSTNPTPTIAAIKSFSAPITIILGGSSKGADFSELADIIKSSSVNNVLVIGIEGPIIREAIIRSRAKISILNGGNSMEDIVETAVKHTDSGGIVLLSPACASFGMFKNYKDRGEKFKLAVNNL